MKIAVSSQGTDLDSQIDPRFGRAAYLLIIDMVSTGIEVIDNAENLDAFTGAGIQAAAMVSDSGAEVLLTGFCGPNAFKTLQAAGVNVVITGNIGPNASSVLEAAGIKTYLCNSGTVREVLQHYRKGLLAEASGHTVSSHFGSGGLGRGGGGMERGMGGGIGLGRGGAQGGGSGGGRGLGGR